jgi:hypothetical protein
MKIESQIEKFQVSASELLANQVVEGFISGMHKVHFMDSRLNLRAWFYNAGKKY